MKRVRLLLAAQSSLSLVGRFPAVIAPRRHRQMQEYYVRLESIAREVLLNRSIAQPSPDGTAKRGARLRKVFLVPMASFAREEMQVPTTAQPHLATTALRVAMLPACVPKANTATAAQISPMTASLLQAATAQTVPLSRPVRSVLRANSAPVALLTRLRALPSLVSTVRRLLVLRKVWYAPLATSALVVKRMHWNVQLQVAFTVANPRQPRMASLVRLALLAQAERLMPFPVRASLAITAPKPPKMSPAQSVLLEASAWVGWQMPPSVTLCLGNTARRA